MEPPKNNYNSAPQSENAYNEMNMLGN